MATLATEIMSCAADDDDADTREVAAAISVAGRLFLEREIVQGLDDVTPGAMGLLNARTFGMLRLPLDPLWLEFSGENWLGRVAPPCGLPRRVGYLVRTLDDGSWEVRLACALAGVTLVFPFRSVIGNEGVVVWGAMDVPHPGDIGVTTMEQAAWNVLRFLLMLTANNAPVMIGPEEDFARLNKGRAKVGKPPVLGCRPVRWDLSRVERRAGGRLSPEDRKRAIGHIVRGHPKVRKSGVYWWSPHYRNVLPGEARPLGRDYRVAA